MTWKRFGIASALAILTTGVLTVLSGCGGCPGPPAEVVAAAPDAQLPPAESEAAGAMPEVPLARPEGWDAIAFNRDRGNAGAIPESYLGDINGPDGEVKHLGKHLPYVPDTTGLEIPDGYVAIMWGDPTAGYAQHPNAPKGAESYPDGHWYDWVRIRKAAEGEAEEVETAFEGWPEPGADDSGRFLVAGGGSIEDSGGKNTIYLVELPPGVKSGDAIRVWAHCLYHGEYVDFIEVP